MIHKTVRWLESFFFHPKKPYNIPILGTLWHIRTSLENAQNCAAGKILNFTRGEHDRHRSGYFHGFAAEAAAF
jgi:hypothetical protein